MSSAHEPSADERGSPHDALFYRTFSQLENAASELKSVLPKEVVDKLDWTSLQVVATRFVDPKLVHRYADLFFSVDMFTQAGVEKAYVHVLFEHESEAKPWSLLQALQYQVRRWEEESRKPIVRGRKRLSPIITVILHHGDTGFTSSTRFRDYFQLDDELRSMLSPFLVDFGVLVDDVGKVSTEALVARPVSLEVQLILFALRYARTPELFLKELPKVAPLIREVFHQHDGNRCIGTVLLYVERVGRIPASELRMALEEVLWTDEALIEEILNPGRMAERLKVELASRDRELASRDRELASRDRELASRDRELERTKRQGRALVLRLLSHRFGPVSPAVTTRVDAASADELEDMAVRVLSATTIEDVLDGAS